MGYFNLAILIIIVFNLGLIILIGYFKKRNYRVYDFLMVLNKSGYDIYRLKPYNKILYSFKSLKIENYIIE